MRDNPRANRQTNAGTGDISAVQALEKSENALMLFGPECPGHYHVQ
jgi:hypothetical protein